MDQSEEQQERFLKELHKKVLFLAFEDPYRKYVDGERRVCVLSEYICTMFSLFECMFLKLYGDILYIKAH